MSVAFSPDGARSVTVSLDGVARLWDSVPYRRRYSAIAAVRRTGSAMTALVTRCLEAGMDPTARAQALAGDASLDEARRVAAFAAFWSAHARDAARRMVSFWVAANLVHRRAFGYLGHA